MASTTQQVAQRLVELCRAGDYSGAHKELYAPDAVSIEPAGTPQPRAQGLEALAAKGKQWQDTFEVHGGSVSAPVVAGDFFSCALAVDVTDKKSGVRFTMEEIGVYEVRAGKVVCEQFFYPVDKSS